MGSLKKPNRWELTTLSTLQQIKTIFRKSKKSQVVAVMQP